MENQPELLNIDDVLSTSASNIMFQCTFKIGEFMAIIKEKLGEEENFFTEGVDCEILRPGKNWQKGKVKMRLEFYPDEPKDIPPEQSDSAYSQIPINLE